MMAISLWQPWASMLVHGLKVFETRDYPFSRGLFGRRIAIHAAKKRVELLPLPKFGMDSLLHTKGQTLATLPLGAIVGSVILVDSFQMGEPVPGDSRHRWNPLELGRRRCEKGFDWLQEKALGDFRDGRWAWQTEKPVALASPIPYRGQQGYFPLDEATTTAIERSVWTAAEPITREISRPIVNEGKP